MGREYGDMMKHKCAACALRQVTQCGAIEYELRGWKEKRRIWIDEKARDHLWRESEAGMWWVNAGRIGEIRQVTIVVPKVKV